MYSIATMASKDIQKILKTLIQYNPKILRLKEKSMPKDLYRPNNS